MTAANGKFVICSGNFERVSEQDVKNFKSKFGIYRAISRLTGIIMHNNKPDHSIKKTSETRGTRNKFVTTETIGKYPKSITLKGIETASAETSTARESRSFFTVKENNSFKGFISTIKPKLTAKERINPFVNKSKGFNARTTITARAKELTRSFFSPKLPVKAMKKHIVAALTDDAVIPHK